MDAGNYVAKMSIEHNAYKWDNDALYKSVKLTINQRPTNITSADVSTTYGANDYLVVTLKDFEGYDLIGKTVSVDLNGVKNYTTNENSQISVPIKGMSAGKYTAVITFNGTNDNYETSTVSVNVSVAKATTLIVSNTVKTVYNGGIYLYATLKDAYGNVIIGESVTVVLNGKTYTQNTDKKGQVKVSTNGLKPVNKYHQATITFNGNANYDKSSTTAVVKVFKANPKFKYSAATFKRSDKKKKYSIRFLTNQNTAMKNAKVYIKVNKKTYAAKTNKKGFATFKLTKLTKKGKYTANIIFKGDGYYNKLTKNVKIRVK